MRSGCEFLTGFESLMAGSLFLLIFVNHLPKPAMGQPWWHSGVPHGTRARPHVSVSSAQLDPELPVFDEDGPFELQPLQIYKHVLPGVL